MKKSSNVLIGLLLGAVAGWLTGYLRWPVVQEKHSFWLGFLACLIAVGIVLILKGVKKRQKEQVRIQHLLLTALFLAGWLLSLHFYNELQTLSADLENKKNEILEQKEYLETAKALNQDVVLNNILTMLNGSLEIKSDGRLSDSIIQIIVDLSELLKPYKEYTNGKLSAQTLSPQKGQLLVAICSMSLDSLTHFKLITGVDFSSADLSGVQLKGKNLRGIHLKGALLRDGELTESDFSGANLENADLWGVNAIRAHFKGTNLVNANMSWTKLNEADLSHSMLNGADLSNAQLRKCRLIEASMKWTQLDNALLEGSDMYAADLFTASLIRANLKNARLSESRLRNADMQEADLNGAFFDKVAVSERWFEELAAWEVGGLERIRQEYHIDKDSSNQFIREQFFTKVNPGKSD